MLNFYTFQIRTIFFLFVFASPVAFAQCGASYCGTNLATNPDFEKTQNPQCAGGFSQNQLWVDSSPLPGWMGTACQACTGKGITPDNYNSTCGGNVTNACDQSKGSVGFFTYTGSGNTREYVQSQLLAPLKAGKKYCVEMDVKSGPNKQACDGLGVYFSNKIYDIDKDNKGSSFFAVTPQVEQPKGVKIGGCTKFAQTFCANGGETCIMIGNFRTDANTTIDNGGFATIGYLIIDNVSIRELCETNPLKLDLTASPSHVTCGNTSVLTLTASGGNGTYTYKWINPSTATGAGPVTVTPTATTTYSVAVTTSGNCGKYTDTAKVTVIVDCGPVVIAIGSTICKDTTASISASVTGGTPPYTFTWNPGNLTGSTQTVTTAVTTTYTVVVKDSKGLADTATAKVIVNQNPVLTVSANPSIICLDSTGTITASGANSYSWSPGGQTGSTISVHPTTLADLTYTVTGKNADGCKSSAKITVPVKDCSILIVHVDSTSICTGTCTLLTSKITGGEKPFTYKWSTGESTANIKVCPIATTSYTLTITDNKGKTATAVSRVTVKELPKIVASDATICLGQSAAIAATGASTYVWSTGEHTSSITVSPTTTTSYSVAGTDLNGCSDTIVTHVTVNPLPVLQCSDITICNDTCGTLLAQGASTYVWQPGGQTGNTFVACPKTTTTYTLSGTTAFGCAATKKVTVNVLVRPVISIIGTSSVCGNQTVKLTANGADKYTWSTGDTTAVIQVQPSTTTTYSVTAGTGSCKSTSNFVLQVKPLPIVKVTNGIICNGESIALIASGADSYVWSNGEKQATIKVNPVQTTSYTVTGTSNGCDQSAISVVTVNPNPTAGFIPNPKATSIKDPSILFNNTTVNGTTYRWDFGDDMTSTLFSPTHSYSDTGHYEVCLIAYSNGCEDKVCETVTVLPEYTFYIPNAFSPNGDGHNEGFIGKGINILEFDMWIFDRWGNLIYHCTDLNSPWIGSINNKPGKENIAQEDVYVWKVHLKDILNKQHSMTGIVTLVK